MCDGGQYLLKSDILRKKNKENNHIQGGGKKKKPEEAMMLELIHRDFTEGIKRLYSLLPQDNPGGKGEEMSILFKNRDSFLTFSSTRRK